MTKTSLAAIDLRLTEPGEIGPDKTVIGEKGSPLPRSGVLDETSIMDKARDENFPVALGLLRASTREDLLSIYGFARLVDDVGDLFDGDRDAALDSVERELDDLFDSAPHHPVFVRLAPTVARLGLDQKPFSDLIAANRIDQRVTRYQSFSDLVGYCELSANPIGSLVLSVFGQNNPVTLALSDRICTALQVIEHLQDAKEDSRAGRIYLPTEDLCRFSVEEPELGKEFASPGLRRLIAFEAARARGLIEEGRGLVRHLSGMARLSVAGFIGGGLAQIDALESARYDVCSIQVKARKSMVARATAGVLLHPSGTRR